MQNLTIIMYHYVRNLKGSRYPRIKGLEVDLFKKQLAYILKYYRVIRIEDLLAAIKEKKTIPNNSLLLTFDDGYRDHFEYVLPILKKMDLQGSFFPPGKTVEGNKVLDVNKIQFTLASAPDPKLIVHDIYSLLNAHRKEYDLESNEGYYAKLAVANRLDTAEVIFIKRLLQHYLPEKLRKIIADNLFLKYVSKDEQKFSKELYMNVDELKHMREAGMYVGSHSYDHCWLNTLSAESQENDIKLSLKFLEKIGCDTREWVMCYPYGAHNESLISLLKNNGCKLGLTTEVKIADLAINDPLILPRLDTNDLPKDENAEPNEWTLKIARTV